MKKVCLYRVSIKHIITNEKISLEVWAENVDDATHKCNFLFDYEGQYRWTGIGPVYGKDGEIITKSIKESED